MPTAKERNRDRIRDLLHRRPSARLPRGRAGNDHTAAAPDGDRLPGLLLWLLFRSLELLYAAAAGLLLLNQAGREPQASEGVAVPGADTCKSAARAVTGVRVASASGSATSGGGAKRSRRHQMAVRECVTRSGTEVSRISVRCGAGRVPAEWTAWERRQFVMPVLPYDASLSAAFGHPERSSIRSWSPRGAGGSAPRSGAECCCGCGCMIRGKMAKGAVAE